MTTAGYLDYTSAVNDVQGMENEYLKTKCKDKNYEALEVIAEGIKSTNQENSAIKILKTDMVKEIKTIKKLLEKCQKRGTTKPFQSV